MKKSERIDVTDNVVDGYLLCSCGHRISYREFVGHIVMEEDELVKCPSCGQEYLCFEEIRIYKNKDN